MDFVRCPKCNAIIEPGGKDCNFCGTKVKADTIYNMLKKESYSGSTNPEDPDTRVTRFIDAVKQTEALKTAADSNVFSRLPVPTGKSIKTKQFYSRDELAKLTRTYPDRITAGILAITLGWLGVHKFYLKRPFIGFIYIIMCTTGLSFIFGIIEGVYYLSMTDADFMKKYGGNNVKKK